LEKQKNVERNEKKEKRCSHCRRKLFRLIQKKEAFSPKLPATKVWSSQEMLDVIFTKEMTLVGTSTPSQRGMDIHQHSYRNARKFSILTYSIPNGPGLARSGPTRCG
jgi:hypothetical protein